jgi:formamidopyrimidine-DNA glycosylase
MPELPEVEVIRTQIQSQLPLHIHGEERSPVISSLLRKAHAPEAFKTKDLVLKQTRRHGKVLVLDFYKEEKHHGVVLSGFGMSGGWRLSEEKIKEPHTHLQWKACHLNGHTLYLAYVDPRRFGSMAFLDPLEADLRLQKLGVDVGSAEFTQDYLKEIFKRFPQKEIKPFLLDQKYFAGIGNYIASEICARAGIRPTRPVGKITQKERERIISSTPLVLFGMGERGGLSFSGGYRDTTGSDGGGLDHLVVFHQKICRLCHKTEVKKIIQAARASFYCPRCQK